MKAIVPFGGLVQAQERTLWSFHCSEPVNWGGILLPAGDYAFSVSASDPRAINLYQTSGQFVAQVAAQTITSEAGSGPTLVFTTNDGDINYVTSVYVSDVRARLLFAKPDAKPPAGDPGTQDRPSDSAVSGDPEPIAGGLFAVHNSTNQAIPYAQAEALYLSACKVVEQEFGRPGAVRPRLTLVVGAGVNGVYFPKREIQLKKWDSYRFTQGVVILAIDDLVPLEKRLTLTQLAVTQAAAIVNLSQLKNEQSAGQLGPQN